MSLTDREKALQLYIDSKGTIALIDIANQLNRPAGTVRGWKSKDDWDAKLSGTFHNETERSKNVERSETKEEIKQNIKIIKEVVANDNLTDKQQLFCIYYLKYFNATKAYQKAYSCSYNTAMVEGSKHLRNPKIKAEIDRFKAERMQDVYLDSKDIMQKYIDIAFSDITDFVEFGTKEVIEITNTGVPVLDEEGEPLTRKVNYVNFKEFTDVDGTLISEVSKGKDGVKLKLNDKMKALEWLSKNVTKYQNDLDVELLEQKIEREKATVNKLNVEIDKIKGISEEIEDLSEIERDIYG